MVNDSCHLNNILQFVKYALIGGSNFLINIIIMNILMKSTGIYKGNMLFLFQVVAFIAYSINGYFLNKKFTFKNVKRKNAYLAYISVMGPAAMFSAFLIRTLTLYNIFNLSSSLWANIIIVFASISIGFISFLINKFLVFK